MNRNVKSGSPNVVLLFFDVKSDFYALHTLTQKYSNYTRIIFHPKEKRERAPKYIDTLS